MKDDGQDERGDHAQGEKPNRRMAVALGAGIGIIFGSAFGSPGTGMVIGAAIGLAGGFRSR